MNKTCYLAVLLAMAALASCRDQPFKKSLEAQEALVRTPARDPFQRENVVEVVADVDEVDVGGGVKQVFQKINTEIRGDFATAFMNQPTLRSSIYPGSLVWFDALNNGQCDVLSHGTTKGDFKVALLSAKAMADKNAVTSFQVDGTFSRFQAELGKLRIEDHALDFDYQVLAANSVEEAITKLGMSAKYLSFAKASGQLDKKKDKRQSSVVIALKQIFFTASTDVSTLPPYGGLLALRSGDKDTDKKLAAEIAKRKSEIAYISDVSYGRVVFLLVRSTASQSELEAAARASGGAWGFGASADLSVKQKQLLESSDIQCVMAGSRSDSDALGRIFTANFEETSRAVKEYLADTMTLSEPLLAVPIVFSARFTRDNATALIAGTADYAEWRPWKYASKGETVEHPVSITLPSPARLKGDGEMDSGDSSVEIKVGYSVRADSAGTGIILDVETVASEWEKKFKRHKDSRLTLEKRFRYPQLVRNGFKIQVLDQGAQKIERFRGENWKPVHFPSFGQANHIEVKYDSAGRSDHRNARASMELILRYRVVEQ